MQYLDFVSRPYHYVSWHRTSAQVGSLDLYSNVESNKMRVLKINWRILSIQILLFEKKLKKIKYIDLLFPLPLNPYHSEERKKQISSMPFHTAEFWWVCSAVKNMNEFIAVASAADFNPFLTKNVTWVRKLLSFYFVRNVQSSWI